MQGFTLDLFPIQDWEQTKSEVQRGTLGKEFKKKKKSPQDLGLHLFCEKIL